MASQPLIVRMRSNVPEEQLRDNIGGCLALGHPSPLECLTLPKRVTVCAGGPSLSEFKGGECVIGLNGAANAVNAEYMVMCDPSPQNIAFMGADRTHLLASRCHPAAVKAAKGPVYTWHMYDKPEYDMSREPEFKGQFRHFVGWGSTIGIRALFLLYAMGARHFDLYGYDSCIDDRENKHHAYPQPWNDGERLMTMEADGAVFFAAPWMIAQVQEFLEVPKKLVGATFTLHGNGLLQRTWQLNQQPEHSHA